MPTRPTQRRGFPTNMRELAAALPADLVAGREIFDDDADTITFLQISKA